MRKTWLILSSCSASSLSRSRPAAPTTAPRRPRRRRPRGSEEERGTAEAAAAEIDEIKRMLDQGLAQYQDGDTAAADTTVGDAYLEHFEKVEHPLEERDHELMDDLEHRISTEIRDEMKEGTSADEVAALVDADEGRSRHGQGEAPGVPVGVNPPAVRGRGRRAPGAGVARADDAQFAQARAQVETARQLTQEAYEAAKAGDRERGYQLARTAYLDHFEHAEVPLRLRDPNLVLDVELRSPSSGTAFATASRSASSARRRTRSSPVCGTRIAC